MYFMAGPGRIFAITTSVGLAKPCPFTTLAALSLSATVRTPERCGSARRATPSSSRNSPSRPHALGAHLPSAIEYPSKRVVASAHPIIHLRPVSRTAARPARAHVAMMVGIEAADCLEEGCEIGTVESLLEQMKAEKNPSTKMLMTIKRLEVLIKSPEDNASDIEKLVSAAARSFSVVDTFNFPGEPIGYTGKVGTTTTAGKSLE